MKILYVILSCEQHKNSRQQWQKETWLNGIDDYKYLDEPAPGMEETYLNAPYKYVDFLKNFYNDDHYDWFFFCDDDTFVNTEKLNRHLSVYNNVENIIPLVIGFRLGEFTIEGTDIKTECCSGGAGMAINNKVVKNMQNYLKLVVKPVITAETDTSLAVWYKLSTPDVVVIDRKQFFRPLSPTNNENAHYQNAITYHYCSKNDFYNLNNVRTYNT